MYIFLYMLRSLSATVLDNAQKLGEDTCNIKYKLTLNNFWFLWEDMPT